MHKLIKNSLYISIFTLSVLPLSYLVRLLLTKNLTLEEFGLFYAMIGFFELIQSFNDFGFSETQLYFIPKFLEQKRLDKVKATVKTQLFNQILTTFFISVVLLVCTHWLLGSVFHSPAAVNIFRVFIIYFIARDFLQNVRVLFFSYQEAAFYGLIEPLRFVATLVLMLLAINVVSFDLLTLTWIWAGVYAFLAISYFGLFIYQHRNILKAPYYPPIKIYKEFIPFLLPTLLSNNISTLFSKGTETLLVLIKGVADVGLYNIAKPISNLALGLAVPMADLLKPYVSQINERQDSETVKKMILIILNAGVFLLLPFSVILTFYSTESIVFLFGAQFVEASMTLKFISFEILFNLMNTFVFGIVFGLGLQKSRATVIYASSVVSLVLSLIFIPVWGPVGVAIANLAYAAIAMFGGLWIIQKKVPFNLPLKNYTIIGGLSLLLIGSQLVLKFFSPPEAPFQLVVFILKVMVGMGLYYVLGIFVFKVIDHRVVLRIVHSAIPQNIRNRLSIGK